MMSFPTNFFVGNVPTSIEVVPAPDLENGPRNWLAATRPRWSYFISSCYWTDPEKFHLCQDLTMPYERGYARGTVYCNVAVIYRSGLEKGLWEWLNKQPIPRKERKQKESFVRTVIDDAIWPVIGICGGNDSDSCPFEHDIAHMGQKFWAMLEPVRNEIPSNFINYDNSSYRIPHSEPGLVYDSLSGYPIEEAFPFGETMALNSEESLNRLYFMGAQLLWGRSVFEHVPCNISYLFPPHSAFRPSTLAFDFTLLQRSYRFYCSAWPSLNSYDVLNYTLDTHLDLSSLDALLEEFLKRWIPVDRSLQGAFMFMVDLNNGCHSHGLNLGRRFRKDGSASESSAHYCGDNWSYLFSDVMFSDLFIAVGCGKKGSFYSILNDTYALMASLLPRCMGLSPSMCYMLHKVSLGTASKVDYEIIGDFFEFLFGILVLQGCGDIISLMVSALVLIQGVKDIKEELQLAVLPDFTIDIQDLRGPAQRLGLSPPTSTLENYVLGLRSRSKPCGWERLSALGDTSFSSFGHFDWGFLNFPDPQIHSLYRQMKNIRGYILYIDDSTKKDQPTEGRQRRRIRDSDFCRVLESSLDKFIHSKECRQLMKRFFPVFATNTTIPNIGQP